MPDDSISNRSRCIKSETRVIAEGLTEKRCTVCQNWHPDTREFFVWNKACGSVQPCKACARERARIYKIEHPENLKASQDKFRATHIEKERERGREYHRRNKDRERPLKKAYADANKTRHQILRRNWHLENREKVKANKQRRRARRLLAGGSFSGQDVKAQYVAQKGLCWWCSEPLTNYHIDHLVPLARGGSNDASNIVLACPHCNLSKSDKMPWEWNGRLL